MQLNKMTLAWYGSLPFQYYREFIEFFKKESMEDRAKLAGFYLRNLILTNINFWDPSLRLGDMQLMALASWLTHEETKVEEVERVIRKEKEEPLSVITELVSPKAIINNQNLISFDPKLAP